MGLWAVERQKLQPICIFIYIYICVYMYMYLWVYIYCVWVCIKKRYFPTFISPPSMVRHSVQRGTTTFVVLLWCLPMSPGTNMTKKTPHVPNKNIPPGFQIFNLSRMFGIVLLDVSLFTEILVNPDSLGENQHDIHHHFGKYVFGGFFCPNPWKKQN